jgi:nitrogen fixation protein FixH
MNEARASKGEFTGKHMALLAISFFGVIIAVNVGMAVVSSTSWTGLVVENSYVASQEFEEKRIAHDKQLAAGWQSDFTYAPGIAQLIVRDGAGNPVDLGPVSLLINRPVGGHDDANLTPARAADGSYSAAVTLGDGVWEAMATATTATGPYELHVRFKVGDAEAEVEKP